MGLRREVETPLSGRVPVDAGARSTPAVGDLINGKYLIEAFIGEGGVGLVAAAQNVELDERVALKFLRPEMLVQTDIVARFMREAKAACSIKSEYVANLYDVGTMPNGAPFLVMEHLDGKDLGKVIEERGHLGYREATEYMMQTCEALAVAHAKGIVHRDIKPENLFLTSRAGMSVIKVLDFGISKAALTGSIFGSALPLVKTVNLMGTPLYMSPEQVRNAETVDSRSDIWSLGMVLYEALTGTLPYTAGSITELCAAILEEPIAPISNYRNDLPSGFVEVLQRCLEKDPNKRFQNVAEVAIAFMPFGPKRARICAERAAQALRSAGLVEESSVRFASTMPPPHGHSSTNPGLVSGPVPAAPSVPNFGVSGSYPMVPAPASSGSLPSNVSNVPSVTGVMPIIPPHAPVPAVASTLPRLALVDAPDVGDVGPARISTHASEAPPQFRQGRGKMIAAFAVVACIAAVAAAFAARVGTSSPQTVAATHDVTPPTGDPAGAAKPATPAAAQAAPATPAAPAVVAEAKPAAAAPVVAAAAPAPVGKKAFSWPPKAAGAPKVAAPPVAAAPAKKLSDEPDLGY